MPAVSPLLSNEEISRRLPALAEWKLEGKTLQRKYRFGSFRDAIAFVNRVADVAEVHDHHPDILVHYDRVTLVLWTHTAGGVTERDFALAADLEKLD